MAAIQESRREFEKSVAGYQEEEDSHIDSTSETDINRQLDTRKAKFHPQKSDIVSSDSQSASVVDKVFKVLACDYGSDRPYEAPPNAPIEYPEAVCPRDTPSDNSRSFPAEEVLEEEQLQATRSPVGAEEEAPGGSQAVVEEPEAERALVAVPEAEKAIVEVRDSERAIVAVPDSEKAIVAVPDSEKAIVAVPDSEKAIVAVPEAEKSIVEVRDSERAIVAVPDSERAIVAVPEAERAIVEVQDSERDIVAVPAQAESTSGESFHRAELAQQEGSKDSLETMAQAGTTEDESSHQSAFSKIKEKLREKEEQLHLKGEKGIGDDPHPELTSVRQEPNVDSYVSTEEGAVGRPNAFEKLKERFEHKAEELKLRGAKGVEEDPHPELTHVNQQPNPDYVLEEDQEFADAPGSFQQTQKKSTDEKEFVDAPVSLQQTQEKGIDEVLPFQQTQEKSTDEEKEFVDAPVSLQQTQEKGRDEALPFQQTQEKSTDEEKEFVDAPASFQQTQEKSQDEALPLERSQETGGHERAIYDVTPPDVEDESSSKSRTEKPLAEVREPIKEEDGNRELEIEGFSSPVDEEELTGDVEDDSKPGFFSKVKQTLWKSNTKDTGADDEKDALENEHGLSSSSSSFDKEPLPTSQPAPEKRSDEKDTHDIVSPAVGHEPGFFSKVKQTLWKSDHKAEAGEHTEGTTALEKQESSSSSSSGEEETSEEKGEEDAKPGFFGKVKQTLWKSDESKKPIAEAGDHGYSEKEEEQVSKDLEGKSSDEEVGTLSASSAPPDTETRDSAYGELLDNLDEKDVSDVPVLGGDAIESTIVPPVSIASDEDNVETTAKVSDEEVTEVGKALDEKLTIEDDDEGKTEHAVKEHTTATDDLEEHEDNIGRLKSERRSSAGGEEGSGFLGRIASKIGYSTSPTNHGRSQST